MGALGSSLPILTSSTGPSASVLRLGALVVLTVIAVGVAIALQRRRPDPPSVPSYRAPAQLDRDDFGFGAARALIVLFSSATCDSCPRAWQVIEDVAAEVVAATGDAQSLAIQRLDVQDAAELHARYRIDGVPTTLVVDAQGVVGRSFFGPITPDDLRSALTSPS